jgi:hypothetical protein
VLFLSPSLQVGGLSAPVAKAPRLAPSSNSSLVADFTINRMPERGEVMLISGHKKDSVYRRYNIVDMEVLKTATSKIEEHQREIVPAENDHRTVIVSTKHGADDKGKPIN